MAERPAATPFADILAARLSRRQVLAGGIAAALAAALPLGGCARRRAAAGADRLHAAPDLLRRCAEDRRRSTRRQVLYRWGDPVGVPGGDAGVPPGRLEQRGRPGAAGRHAPRRHAVLPAARRVARAPRTACSRSTTSTSTTACCSPTGTQTWTRREGAQGAGRGRRVGHRGRARRTARGRSCGRRRYARRITADTPCAVGGPAAGSALMRTARRSRGPRGARHLQRLRPRLDAVGHLSHVRGELATSTS